MSYIAKNTSRNRAIINYASGSMLQNSLIIRNGDLYLINETDIELNDLYTIDKSSIKPTDIVINTLDKVKLVE